MVRAVVFDATVHSNRPLVRSPPVHAPLPLNVAPWFGQRKPVPLITAIPPTVPTVPRAA